MSQHQKFYFLGVMFLGAINLCDVASAQGVGNYPPPPAIDYLKPEQIAPQKYSRQNICNTILSSEWRYYQRMRSSGSYSYPTAEAIRLQRKWESKKGCPHLYEADGTVNKVRGIND